ncbi:MAG: AAA family ATPase [bacterium]|nr:AAA family ATPase [bacterium]
MYNEHFGFSADPFRVNPDPRFLYMSESHQEALATLIYAVNERKGFIVLTGEVGTGKTTIVNALLQKLSDDVQAVYLFNTALGIDDFFACMLDELDLESVEPFRKSTALRRLNHHLIERLRKGKQTLLVIDESQNLSDELLEEIRMLSNLETPQSKLLQIILVGQPELHEKLEQSKLRQLRQRVELRHTIQSLDAHQTATYVNERMMVAGNSSGDVFTHAALRLVFKLTAGIPRVINVLCDNALLTAYASVDERVTPATIEKAARDMGLLDDEAKPAPKEEAVVVSDEIGNEPSEGWIRRMFGWRRTPRAGALGEL